jgi:hypothetical protein
MLAFLRRRGRPLAPGGRKVRLFAATCCRLVWGFLTDPSGRRAVQTAELVADGRATPTEQAEAFRLANAVAQGLHGVFICGGVNVPGSNYAALAATAAVAPGLRFEYTDGGEDGRRCFTPWQCAALAIGQEAWEHADGSFPPDGEDEQQPSDGWYERKEEAASAAWHAAILAARREQCLLLRDIFNPFDRHTLEPGWLTPAVTALAQAAYEERLLPPDDLELPDNMLTIPQIRQRAWKRAPPAGHLERSRLGVLADALEEAGCSDRAVLDHLRNSGPHVRGCWALDLLLGKG